MVEFEGVGWRLSRDPSKKKFPVLIGGDGWAIELTGSEWEALFYLVSELVQQHELVESQLLPEESITLELSRNNWWGSLEGDLSNWSLRLILEGDDLSVRGMEVCWPQPAAQEFVRTMRNCWDSWN